MVKQCAASLVVALASLTDISLPVVHLDPSAPDLHGGRVWAEIRAQSPFPVAEEAWKAIQECLVFGVQLDRRHLAIVFTVTSPLLEFELLSSLQFV